MASYKPDNYPDIAPYLILADPEVSLRFIERMFGGERLRVIKDDAGRIRHAEIRLGDIVLMMGGALADWPAQPAHFHHYVADVDAVFRRAIELGASAVQEPVQRDDADKRGGFKEPGGITWWIATQLDAH